MLVSRTGTKHVIRYSDEPPREGVRPCANYMYESLAKADMRKWSVQSLPAWERMARQASSIWQITKTDGFGTE